MNEVNTNGTAENQTVETKQRGRKRNPEIVRPIALKASGDTFVPRGKGAPKPGETVTVVYVQASVKNSEYQHGVTPVVRTETMVVPPRQYKTATVTVAPATAPVVEAGAMPVETPVATPATV